MSIRYIRLDPPLLPPDEAFVTDSPLEKVAEKAKQAVGSEAKGAKRTAEDAKNATARTAEDAKDKAKDATKA